MADLTDYTEAGRLINEILKKANILGVKFIVYSGFLNGSLDLNSSDVDIIFKDRKNLNLFIQQALHVLNNRIITIRKRRHVVQIIFQVGNEIFMLDLVTGFYLEHICYVDGEFVFTLQDMGYNIVGLLKAIKHLNGVKVNWPYLPPKIYYIKALKLGLIDRLLIWYKRIIRRISSYFRPKNGIMVVLLGPDGAGKSTLANEIKEYFDGKRNIIPTVIFHWIPPVKLTIKGDVDRKNKVIKPHGLAPRGKILSIIKLGYLFIKFWLGYIVNVRPLLSQTGIILFDRYYDDLIIDPKRYRYGGPMGLARWLRKFIPRPDLWLILDVREDVAIQRKQEIPLEEIKRLRNDYRRLVEQLPNAYLLDGNLPLVVVAGQALKMILNHLRERSIVSSKDKLKMDLCRNYLG